MEDRALIAFVLALALTAAVTPLVARLARRVGALDPVQERGLASEPTPLLGGLAILAGVLVAGVLLLPATTEMRGILIAALLITIVGLLDDLIDLPPQLKLLGQVAAGLICVLSGVRVDDFTFPFVGRVDLGDLGGPLTLIGLVLIMNVVNFSDGVDGLAAGVCAIAAIGFAVIAFDLHEDAAGILAACTAGAALGFLVHNFHPASVFMGDSGSNLLGLLLGGVIVEGSLKTNALIALVVPLVILAVPFLDTGFVVAKRIKYRRPVYRARLQPLPPPLPPHGLLAAQDRALPLRVDDDDDRDRRRAALRPVLGEQRPPQRGLGDRDGRDAAGRARRLDLPRLRAGDPQAPPAARVAAARVRTPTPASTRSTTGSRRTSRPASSPRCADAKCG